MADQSTVAQDSSQEAEAESKGGRAWYFVPLVGLGVLVGVFVLVLVGTLFIAVVQDSDNAAHWISIIRDLFIIVLAMEGLVMGFALIVLVMQLAALVNLLQREIKPVVDNTNDTMKTVRGTAQFISQSVVEPVVKFGAMTTGVAALLREIVGIRRSLKKAQKEGQQAKQG
jgi:hypothetical protein